MPTEMYSPVPPRPPARNPRTRAEFGAPLPLPLPACLYSPERAGLSPVLRRLKFHHTLHQDRADGYGPTIGLIRELRIRWRLFRRGHSLGRRHAVLLIVAIAGCWIALSLYRGLGTDAALHRQVLSLQAQTQSISRQVVAQREELKGASSSVALAEIARSEGLVAPGEKAYALENPVQAAGPGAIQQGIEEVGETAQALVQATLGLP